MKTRRHLHRAALALCLLSVSSRPVLATPREEAAQHFAYAMQLVGEGRIQEGLGEFVRAYELVPHYAVLYNIGRAHADLGQPVQAADAFRRYLELGGQEVSPDRRENVEQDIARLESSVASIDVRLAVAEARVEVDGATAGRSPLGAPIRVNPGVHQVRAFREGYRTASEQVTLAAGQRLTVSLALQPETMKEARTDAETAPRSRLGGSPAEARSKGRGQRTAALALGGAGLVASGVAAGFALHAWSKERDAREECGVGGDSLACTARGLEANRAALAASSRARITAALGGALIATAAVLWLTAPSASRTAAQLRIGASSGLDGRSGQIHVKGSW